MALDVSKRETIPKAAQEVEGILGGGGIDYLINNAGIVRLFRLSLGEGLLAVMEKLVHADLSMPA